MEAPRTPVEDLVPFTSGSFHVGLRECTTSRPHKPDAVGAVEMAQAGARFFFLFFFSRAVQPRTDNEAVCTWLNEGLWRLLVLPGACAKFRPSIAEAYLASVWLLFSV